jgi:hypothetical protein
VIDSATGRTYLSAKFAARRRRPLCGLRDRNGHHPAQARRERCATQQHFRQIVDTAHDVRLDRRLRPGAAWNPQAEATFG